MLAAIVLAAAALALPPARVASWLVGGAPPQTLADVQLGVWLFKATLLAHAALLMGAARTRFPWHADAPLAEGAVNSPAAIPRRDLLVLAGLLALALVIRLYALGDELWFDEIQTLLQSVQLSVGRLIATIQTSNQHALFSLLAKGSVALLGESVFALRLPAVLFGVASLAALFWFATLITTRREALLAVALLTVSYHHVWFSQNARGYTGLLLWTLLGTGIFLRLLASRELRSWWLPAAYGIAMALAIYTHLTAALIVAAHAFIWLLLVLRGRRAAIWPVAAAPFVGMVLAGSVSALLYAVSLPQLVKVLRVPAMEGMDTVWKTPTWAVAETLNGLTQGNPIVLAVLAGGAVVGIAGVVSFGRRHWSVAAMMLLPGLLTAAVLLAKAHNLWPRFFFFSAGFAILIAIRGVFAMAPVLRTRHAPALATAAVLAVIAVSALAVPRAWGPKQDYEGARRFVESRRSAQDAVVTVDMTVIPYKWYYRIPWDSASTGAELEAIEARHARTWVLYQFPVRLEAVQPTTWSRLQERYRPAAEFPGTLGGGSIFVMVSQ